MQSVEKKKSQVDKFKDAARELEADQSEENFDRLVKRIAKSPTQKPEPPKEGAKVTEQVT